MKQALLLIVLGLFLAYVASNVFSGFDTSMMSIHGWIALGLGTVFSLLLGIVLMVLVFYSARRGYDDRVPRDEPESEN